MSSLKMTAEKPATRTAAEKSAVGRFWEKYFALVTLFFLIVIPFLIFALTRFGPFTTYVPFSGKVFQMDSASIESFSIRDGSTGTMINYETEEDINEMAEFLGAFRSDYWVPDIPIPRSGWSYAVVVFSKDGTSDSFEFTPYWIQVRGIQYHIHDAYFDGLIDMVEKSRA